MQPTSSTRFRFSLSFSCVYRCLLIGLLFIGSGCAPARPAPSPSLNDDTPRLAIISAFEPELKLILSKMSAAQRYEINGRSFYTGTIGDDEVLVFLSGVSMVNAAMTTQSALDHFKVSGILFSGIAGGVNPSLHIGDVVIPAEWAQYQEQVFARAKGSGWDTGYHAAKLGNYGMMFPQAVSVTHAGGQLDKSEDKFWFAVDAKMLAAARKAAAEVELKRCPSIGSCLQEAPQIIVGGKGVSGPTFVDNAAYRTWVWENFQADALDMESAAVAQVAYNNNVPFLAFRSLSDLAGGGPGANELPTFLQLAADHSAAVLINFLQHYP